MVIFERKIYYIDYFENGERRGNVGFLRLTTKEKECLVHVGIRNIPRRTTLTCRWFGIKDSRRYFLEEFEVKGGNADYRQCYKKDSPGRREIDIAELDGFYFSLGDKKWGSCFARFKSLPPLWEEEEMPDRKTEENEIKGCSKEERTEDEIQDAKDYDDKEENDFERNEKIIQEEKEVSERTSWEELIKTHQRIHPFEKQGDYISINPFTLKLLAPKYRNLAHNSFLLHGFYNYRHIILGYYTDEEREGYYIGVPGTFHEKEQMVAEMFGFEGYESSGDMGYYMRRVEF